jgi:hypothetical protein
VLPLAYYYRTWNMPPPSSAATNKVFKIYIGAVKTSLNEHQTAFDAAVGASKIMGIKNRGSNHPEVVRSSDSLGSKGLA